MFVLSPPRVCLKTCHSSVRKRQTKALRDDFITKLDLKSTRQRGLILYQIIMMLILVSNEKRQFWENRSGYCNFNSVLVVITKPTLTLEALSCAYFVYCFCLRLKVINWEISIRKGQAPKRTLRYTKYLPTCIRYMLLFLIQLAFLKKKRHNKNGLVVKLLLTRWALFWKQPKLQYSVIISTYL